jgi:hypothetical protein
VLELALRNSALPLEKQKREARDFGRKEAGPLVRITFPQTKLPVGRKSSKVTAIALAVHLEHSSTTLWTGGDCWTAGILGQLLLAG